MDHTRVNLIERPSGSGKYYDPEGRFVENCRYTLEVTQEMHEAGNEIVPGLRNITGEISGAPQLINYFGLHSPLILELSDGRRVKFYSDEVDQSDGGTIQGTGDFFTGGESEKSENQ